MALSSDRDKINGEALRFLMDVESRRQLDHDELEDMEEPLNTFRHVHSLEMLHTLLEEMYGKMQGRNYIDRRSCELRYIWTNFDTLRDLWDRTTMSTKWKESWFLAHLHVPVLGILRTIVDTEYKMADIKGMAAALTNIDLRNDAILHHISLALDHGGETFLTSCRDVLLYSSHSYVADQSSNLGNKPLLDLRPLARPSQGRTQSVQWKWCTPPPRAELSDSGVSCPGSRCTAQGKTR
ncbi:hypothetical protein B0O80DRAFT_173055 [Mortierella sp. GBAus27b]|nr:hypothetical protein B0O80DRAFT_173055 [Mortierella sp. GBAus27b]